MEWLEKLDDAKYRSTYWYPYAKFRKALYEVNNSGDLSKSFDLYGEIIEKYPDHPISELAHAYYCINACSVKDLPRAERASAAFMSKYAASKWTIQINKMVGNLRKENEK